MNQLPSLLQFPVREAINPTTRHYNPIKKTNNSNIQHATKQMQHRFHPKTHKCMKKTESNESYSSKKYNRTKISLRYSPKLKKIKRESDSLEEMSAIKELGLFPDENSMKPVRFCSKPDSNGSSWSVDSNEDGAIKRRRSRSSENLTFDLGFLRELGETRKKPRVFESPLFFWEGELSLRFGSLRFAWDLRERKLNAWASLYTYLEVRGTETGIYGPLCGGGAQ